MMLIDAKVMLNREIVPGIHLLRLTAPAIARDALPGQFVHVRCSPGTDPLLRRPISLRAIGRPVSAPLKHESEEASALAQASCLPRVQPGEIELLVARVGRGTGLLAALEPGKSLSVLGPLGKGFEINSKSRNVLLVAGGMGVAPLSALAAEAVARDLSVTMLAGFRSAATSLPPWLLPPETEYVICTDDGSAGRRGVVTDYVADFIEWADEIFACGPRPMLLTLAQNPHLRGLPVQVSLEERMGCAVGACLGCVVRTRGGLRRVCRDGPVFDLRDIVWD